MYAEPREVILQMIPSNVGDLAAWDSTGPVGPGGLVDGLSLNPLQVRYSRACMGGGGGGGGCCSS